MSESSTARARWLWCLAAAWLLLIYSTLSVIRVASEALRARGLLRLTVTLLFAAAALAVLAFVLRSRPGWREWSVLGAAAASYLALLGSLSIPEERFHLLQYGVLALLVHGALEAGRWRRGAAPAVGAILITALAGLGDEIIQGLLPNRYYGHRDVALNALAGVLVVAILHAARRARRRDRGLARPQPAQ